MAIPPEVALSAARLSKAIFDISRKTIDDERDAASAEYQAAILAVIDPLIPRIRTALRRAGPDSTVEEVRTIRAEVAVMVEDAREAVAALHRPFVVRMVDLAREHAAAMGLEEPEAGLVALEAAVLQLTQDSQGIFDRLIERVFGALDRVHAPAVEEDDDDSELVPVGFFGTLRGNLKAMVTILSGVYVITQLEAFASRGVVRVEFIHDEPLTDKDPCPICSPLVGQTFPIQTAPVPPLHPSCHCRLAPA